MKSIQKMLTVLLVFARWLTVAQACHEEKNDWLSGHKDKFSTNAITLSTEDTIAFISTSTSCDAYTFFLHKKYDQVVENAAPRYGRVFECGGDKSRLSCAVSSGIWLGTKS